VVGEGLPAQNIRAQTDGKAGMSAKSDALIGFIRQHFRAMGRGDMADAIVTEYRFGAVACGYLAPDGRTKIKGVKLADAKAQAGVSDWRFDWCIPGMLIAGEYEGGVWGGKSRHTTGSGYSGDISKYNAATRLGWRVFRYARATRADAQDFCAAVLHLAGESGSVAGVPGAGVVVGGTDAPGAGGSTRRAGQVAARRRAGSRPGRGGGGQGKIF